MSIAGDASGHTTCFGDGPLKVAATALVCGMWTGLPSCGPVQPAEHMDRLAQLQFEAVPNCHRLDCENDSPWCSRESHADCQTFSEVLRDLDDLISRYPGYPNLLLLRANHFANHGRNEDALRDYDESIALFLSNPTKHFPSHESDYPLEADSYYGGRARFFEVLGRCDEALADYGRCVDLATSSGLKGEYCLKKAVLLGVLGRGDESSAWLRRSREIRRWPDRYDASYTYHLDRGLLFEKLGCLPEALEDYRRNLESGAVDAGLCTRIAVVLSLLGQSEESSIWLERAGAAYPADLAIQAEMEARPGIPW